MYKILWIQMFQLMKSDNATRHMQHDLNVNGQIHEHGHLQKHRLEIHNTTHKMQCAMCNANTLTACTHANILITTRQNSIENQNVNRMTVIRFRGVAHSNRITFTLCNFIVICKLINIIIKFWHSFRCGLFRAQRVKTMHTWWWFQPFLAQRIHISDSYICVCQSTFTRENADTYVTLINRNWEICSNILTPCLFHGNL